MIRKSWRGPVWGLFVAAAIVAGAFYLWGWWPIVLSLAHAAPSLLTSFIPAWVLILLAPVVVFGISLAYFVHSTRESELREPDFVTYTGDIIFDIDWSWRWLPPTLHGNLYTLNNLTPHCPVCSAALGITEHGTSLVSCTNASCHWQWERHYPHQLRIHDPIELDTKVRTEIDRRIHTGACFSRHGK